MKPYDISNEEVKFVLVNGKTDNLKLNKIASISRVSEHKYPIKVIYKIIYDEIAIITCYSIIRECNSESNLC